MKIAIAFLATLLTGCLNSAVEHSSIQSTPGPIGPQGPAGSVGPSGTPGQNGHNSLIAVVSADASVCAYGGTIVSVGVDLNDNGMLDDSEVAQKFAVCNGSTDGNDSKSNDKDKGKE